MHAFSGCFFNSKLDFFFQTLPGSHERSYPRAIRLIRIGKNVPWPEKIRSRHHGFGLHLHHAMVGVDRPRGRLGHRPSAVTRVSCIEGGGAHLLIFHTIGLTISITLPATFPPRFSPKRDFFVHRDISVHQRYFLTHNSFLQRLLGSILTQLVRA